MMAISHHIIVQYAAHRAGILEPEYYVLGDDMLIKGDDLYRSYLKTISELKMKLNVDKTYSSLCLFEFAKRFYFNGVEVSPFPLGSILRSKGDYALMSVGLDNAIAKSWFDDMAISSRRKLYRRFLEVFSKRKGCSAYAAESLHQLVELNQICKWIQDEIDDRPYGVGLLPLNCNYTDNTHKKVISYMLRQAQSEVAKVLFRDSSVNISKVYQEFMDYEDIYESSPDLIDEGVLRHPLTDCV